LICDGCAITLIWPLRGFAGALRSIRPSSTMKNLKSISVALVMLALMACDAITGLFSGDCTTMPIPAISVTVVDSLSGAPLAPGSTVRARDGAYADSLVVPADTNSTPFPIGLALERAGVYQVSVSHPGYRDWSAVNVRTSKAGCHVRTAVLIARLVRSP